MLLALLAASFAVLLFAPAQRFVRSLFLQLRPPEWAADYIAPGPLATAALSLHFLLPALTALLWVREGGKLASGLRGHEPSAIVLCMPPGPAQAAGANGAQLAAPAAPPCRPACT